MVNCWHPTDCLETGGKKYYKAQRQKKKKKEKEIMSREMKERFKKIEMRISGEKEVDAYEGEDIFRQSRKKHTKQISLDWRKDPQGWGKNDTYENRLIYIER